MIRRLAIGLLALVIIGSIIAPALLFAKEEPVVLKVRLDKQPKEPVVVNALAEAGIDKRYVELSVGYGLRSEGKSPYSQIWADRRSGTNVMVISILPHVTADGQPIESGWESAGGKYVSKPNLFYATVEDGVIRVTALSDQPHGAKEGDWVEWNPRLYLDGVEQLRGGVRLLTTDPVNAGYFENTLEFDYGVAKRRIRIIEGRISEKWVFDSAPNIKSSIRIVHNHTGKYPLTFGSYAINDDEERVLASVFDEVAYPFEVGASPETFYPDADPETSSVDGFIQHLDGGGLTWAAIRTAAGQLANDSAANDWGMAIRCNGNTDEWDLLTRSIFLFDTSGLPDGATVTGATFSVRSNGKGDAGSIAPDLNVYKSTPFANTALQADDFVDIGTTALCATPITYAGWSTVAYNDFALTDVDTDDFGYISKTSITKLGTRNANYDVSGTTPAWGSGELAQMTFYFADNGGTDRDPKLVVTYTEPPAVTTNAATNVEETTATGNGNVTAVNDTNIIERGFVWDTVTHGDPGNVAPGASAYSDNWTEVGTFGTGAYTYGLTGLTKGELYFMRACAKNDAGMWAYGAEVTFLTKPDEPSGFTATGEVVDGRIALAWTKGTGAQKTYIRGEIGSYPTDRADGALIYNDTGVSFNHDGLTGGDTWYYRAWSYATEGALEQYSDAYVQDFALALELPIVTTTAVANIGNTEATHGGNITSTGGENNAERGFVWDTTSRGDPGNVAPGASAYSDNWTEAGSFGTGAYTNDQTGLAEGTLFYVRACSNNTIGWDYGAEVSFTTSELALWFQPINIIEASIDEARETADNGTTTTLVDAALVEADDYWNGYILEIITTTDGLAPQGEIRTVTDFTAGDDTLYFVAMTVTVGAGDTYELRSFVLVDRAVYLYTADGGAVGSLDDAELTEGDDYWNGSVLYIVSTTDGLAPQGEFTVVEDFVAGTDTLDFPTFVLSAAPEAGDTYYLRNDGHITWGTNPAGVTVVISSMESSSQPGLATPGADVTVDYLPPAEPGDWYIEPDVSGTLLTNPLRPFVTIMSDTTNLTERQAWVFMGLAFCLLVCVATAVGIREHLLLTGITTGGAVGICVAQTIFPMWALVFIILCIFGGVLAERTPSV